MERAKDASTLRLLPAHECVDMLVEQEVGRVAFVVDGEPDIAPVNYVMDDGSVILRVDPDGRLASKVDGAMVAFQVDELAADTRSGWSVVVRGEAHVVDDPDEIAALRRLPLRPWAPGKRDCFVRIVPTLITGRQLEPGAEVTTLWLG